MDIVEAYRNRLKLEDDPLLGSWFEKFRNRRKEQVMFEPGNPDWTKTPEERDRLRSKDFNLWWKVEHQYPHQSGIKPIRRRWLNPFYSVMFSCFWDRVQKQLEEKIE